MAVADCIEAGVLDGHISRKTADEAQRKFREFGEGLQADSRLSQDEWEIRSAQRLEADLARDRTRRKRMRVFQAAKQAEIAQRIAAAPVGLENKAALAVLEFDPSLTFVGDNVVSRHVTLRGKAWSLAADFIDKFRSRMGGLTRDTSELGDVVKALFGETVENQNARALAQGVQAARSYLVRRHNAAGGDIRLRKDWGWVQSHNPESMMAGTRIGTPERAAAKQAWIDFTFSRLDPSRMFDAAGQPMTSKQVRQTLEAAWKELTEGVTVSDPAGEFTSPVNRRIHRRELAFKDAAAWIEYQERFGSGDMLSAIIGELDKLARDTALIEIMGPYPKATLQAMKDRVVDASKHAFIDAVFANVSGAIGTPVNKAFARWSQGYRNISTAAKLGSAVFMSISDFGTALTTATMNGLPQVRLIRNYLSQLSPTNPAHRKMAARLGYIAETWIGDLVAAQRTMGEVAEVAHTAKIADTILRISGMSAHTEGLKNAFRLTFLGHLSDVAGMPWDRLADDLRQSMQRHGITEADWELYRSTPFWTDPETRADFIRPEDVHLEFQDVRLSPEERQARFKAAQKFADMIDTEARFAVVAPTARSRALTVATTQPGTFWGEMARNFLLFRSWMAAFTYLHASRIRTLPGGAFNKITYAANVAIPLTLAGAFATQMSQIVRGRDPLDMTTPGFWGQAVLRGGALGPFGDLIVAGQTRWGGGFAEALGGPAIADLDNLRALVESGIKGDLSKLTGDFRRLAEGLLPGNTLWYTRTAFDRLVKDQLELLANPDVASQWRRAETKARNELKQKFWWRRGRATPDRLPQIGVVVGANS